MLCTKLSRWEEEALEKIQAAEWNSARSGGGADAGTTTAVATAWEKPDSEEQPGRAPCLAGETLRKDARGFWGVGHKRAYCVTSSGVVHTLWGTKNQHVGLTLMSPDCSFRGLFPASFKPFLLCGHSF